MLHCITHCIIDCIIFLACNKLENKRLQADNTILTILTLDSEIMRFLGFFQTVFEGQKKRHFFESCIFIIYKSPLF